MTYQAASGAGAQNMRELISGMGYLYNNTKDLLDDPRSPILDIDSKIAELQRGEGFPSANFGVPLAGSLISYRQTIRQRSVERRMGKVKLKPTRSWATSKSFRLTVIVCVLVRCVVTLKL